jgi:hypothetical protein
MGPQAIHLWTTARRQCSCAHWFRDTVLLRPGALPAWQRFRCRRTPDRHTSTPLPCEPLTIFGPSSPSASGLP